MATTLAVKPEAQKQFEQGLAFEKMGQFPQAIAAYEKAVWADFNFAEPYNRIALLYIDLDDPTVNIKAEQAIAKALKRDTDNPEYHITYGKLLEHLGRTLDARTEFNLATELDPANTEAWNLLGLNNEDRWFRFKDAIMLGESVIFDIGHQTKTDREKAAASYQKILELEPDNLDAFLRLFLVHYDSGETDKIETIFESHPEVWERTQDDFHTYLYKGLVLQALYRFEEADSVYGIALKWMPAEEEAFFASLAMIITPDQEKELKKQLAEALPDSSGRVDFEEKLWREKDPLYLTDINERELEHYRRIAYADIRFQDPTTGQRGYETDQGQLYIRFGEPREKATVLPDMDFDMSGTGIISGAGLTGMDGDMATPPTMIAADSARLAEISPKLREEIYRAYVSRRPSDPGSGRGRFHARGLKDEFSGAMGSTMGRDIWNYGDFVVTFADWSGQGHYRLVPDRENDVPTIIEEKPDIFVPDYGGDNFDLYGYYATFRGGDNKTILDLSYAIPTRWLEHETVQGDWQRTDFDNGLFIFDSERNEVFRDVQSAPLAIKAHDGVIPDELIVDERYLELEPGAYQLSVEVQDKKTKNTGVSRQELELPSYGREKLQLSDLVVAYRVSPREKVYFSRKDVVIRSNPSRIFKRDQTLHVYYEIYNLTKDASGRYAYRIETTVAEPGWKLRGGISRFFFDLGKLFGAPSQNVYIGLASDYRSAYDSHPRAETVDIRTLSPRQYLLNIRVIDLATNDTADKDFLFAVADETAEADLTTNQ